MIHNSYDEDGDRITELDAEAIDYFIRGLTELRDMEPGEELVTPSMDQNEDGTLGMSYFILRRAADAD